MVLVNVILRQFEKLVTLTKFHDVWRNKTKDWALVQKAALVMKIKVLKLGLVR